MIFVLLSAGCINDTSRFKQVDVVGTAIPFTDSDQGVLHVIAYHAQYGSGSLAYPFLEFDRTEFDDFEFEWSINVPQEEGEGLAIRAWLDTDGDGNFCSPDFREEYGGTVVFDDVDWVVEAEIPLTDPCDF
jgi:hypothetical protein